MTRRPKVALLAMLAALAAGLAACGGDDDASQSRSGPNPASIVPPDAPTYLEAVVRPEGEQADALEGALSKLLDTDDLGGFIARELDQELEEAEAGISYDEDFECEACLTYEDDIEPWLGERAGAFFDTLSDEPDGAAIVSLTDEEAARAAIDRMLSGDQRVREEAHRGIEYRVDGDGTATGIVEEFVVVGSPRGFEAAVDASGGESLADDARYSELLAAAPKDAVATLHGDPQAILDALEAEAELSQPDRATLERRIGAALEEPFFGALMATPDSLTLELSYARVKGTPEPKRSPLLDLIPEEAWLGFAVSDLGSYLGRTLDLVAAQHPHTASGLDSLERILGVDQREIGAWAGDIGGYVTGTSIFGFGGALIIETEDEDASADTLVTIQRTLSEQDDLIVESLESEDGEGFSITPAALPIRFEVVQRGGTIVAGPQGSVEQVLSPEEALEESERYQAATAALGEGLTPVMYLDFVPLLEFLDGIPNVGDDPGYRRAQPHLEQLDYLVGGSRRDGDRDRMQLVLGLRERESR